MGSLGGMVRQNRHHPKREPGRFDWNADCEARRGDGSVGSPCL